MLGKIIGAAIGGRVARSDGGNGVKGALIGAVAPAVLRRLGPLGLALGGAYLVHRGLAARDAGRS